MQSLRLCLLTRDGCGDGRGDTSVMKDGGWEMAQIAEYRLSIGSGVGRLPVCGQRKGKHVAAGCVTCKS